MPVLLALRSDRSVCGSPFVFSETWSKFGSGGKWLTQATPLWRKRENFFPLVWLLLEVTFVHLGADSL
jgi:hypothetical protein